VQSVVDVGVQLPAPSQVDAPSSFDPEQPGAAQLFPTWSAHLPAPSQRPFVPQLMEP
jgi:hypothetical protein